MSPDIALWLEIRRASVKWTTDGVQLEYVLPGDSGPIVIRSARLEDAMRVAAACEADAERRRGT